MAVALSGVLVVTASGLALGGLVAGRRVLAECRRTLAAARLSRDLAAAAATANRLAAAGAFVDRAADAVALMDRATAAVMARAAGAVVDPRGLVSSLAVVRSESGRALGLEALIAGADPPLRLFAPFRSGAPRSGGER